MQPLPRKNQRAGLLALRNERGITQAKAADLIDISETYLQALETERMPLTDSAMVKIARGYRITFEALEKRVGPPLATARSA